MAGYDARTGKPLHGDDRIAQSIRRLIVTEGSLILRRHLDNPLPRMVGTPFAIGTFARCARIASVIMKGEKRCDLRAVRPSAGSAEDAADGKVKIEIAALSRETGLPINLTETIQ